MKLFHSSLGLVCISVLQGYMWDNMVNFDKDPITRLENVRALKVSRLDKFGALNAEAIRLDHFLAKIVKIVLLTKLILEINN